MITLHNVQKIRLLTLAGLFSCFFNINAQEHTIWRNGTNGIYVGTGLMDSWPETGPEILWSFEGLGQGHSSPVIFGDFIYTVGMIDGTGYLFKFNLEGKLIFKSAYGPEFTDSYYGTRGTPVITEGKIYQVSGYGHVICMNEEDGEKLWEIDMVKDFGGKTITWGYNETPVINGNVIYCTPGGKNCVIALNRNTGKLIWTCKADGELSAYCTPLLFTHKGRKILATHTASHLIGIDAISGKMLWSYAYQNQWSAHANTPIYQDGGLFFFSGWGKGSGKLILSDDGSEISLAWNSPMDSRMGGAVLIDGYIYGSGDNSRAWRAIDWETGKDNFSSEAFGKGVIIAADGKLFCYSEQGELALVNVRPDKFDLVSKTRVTLGSEQHWAHPVIDNGVLYLRHGKTLIAYRVK